MIGNPKKILELSNNNRIGRLKANNKSTDSTTNFC